MRQTIMPNRKGCTSADATVALDWLFRKTTSRLHQWEHKHHWNGNSKDVLPFETQTSGIPRSGWRCYHCGKFDWDDSDEVYALKQAYHRGLLPDFSDLMMGGGIKIKPQSTRNHDAAVDVSAQRKFDKELKKGVNL